MGRTPNTGTTGRRTRPATYLFHAADRRAVRLLHRRGSSGESDERVLASDVDVARSIMSRARGLTFRRSIPDGYGLAFRFDGVGTRTLHMLFVPFAIDAVWLVDEEVTRRKRLAPFVGIGRGTADTVVELPAGAADGVDVGDEVVLDG